MSADTVKVPLTGASASETDMRAISEAAKAAAAECVAFVDDFIEEVHKKQFREWHRNNQPSIVAATERPRRKQSSLFTGTYEYSLPAPGSNPRTGTVDESFKIAYLAWRISQPNFTTTIIRKLRAWDGIQPDPDEWLPGLFKWCIKDMRQRERPGLRDIDQMLPNDYYVITTIPPKGPRTVKLHCRADGYGRWPGLLMLCDDKGMQEPYSSFPDAGLPLPFADVSEFRRAQEAEFEELQENEGKTPKKRKTSGNVR